MIVPFYQFYFEDRNSTSNTLTKLVHDVDGWKEYGVVFGRESGVSNVVKSYTNEWIFIGKDAEYIKNKFYSYGANAKIRLIVKKLTNFLQKKYEIEYAGYFDFTQIDISGTVSIPLTEGGFFKLIENQWSKDFDITMNNVVVGFNGIKTFEDAAMKYIANFTMFGDTLVNEKSFIIGLNNLNSEAKSEIFVNTQNLDITGINTFPLSSCFLQLKSGVYDNLKISYDLDFNITLKKMTEIGIVSGFDYLICPGIVEYKYSDLLNGVQNPTPLRQFWIKPPTDDPISGVSSVFTTSYNLPFKKNGAIFIEKTDATPKVYMFYVGLYLNSLDFKTSSEAIVTFNKCNVYTSIELLINYNKRFQCVRSNHVFQELIHKINNNKYNVEIDFTELNKIVANDQVNRYDLLTNGNGLRGFPVGLNQDFIDCMRLVGLNYEFLAEFSWAKLTTSLEQYLKYLYIVHGLKINLKYDIIRDKYFVSLLNENQCFVNSKIDEFKEVSQCHIKPVREFLYTQIKVGYSTKDDSIGGKEEYNGTLEFSTMITEIEENILDFVSPYSASVFDIETFIYNNYQNFEDSADKDTEIFIICGKRHPTEGLGYFILRREIPVTSGLAFPETAWNVDLTPRRILETHSKFLNSCFAFHVGEKLMIATAKRNKSLDAGNIVESDPILITNNRLFFPLQVEFSYPATSKLIPKIEQNRNGYIGFEYGGKKLKGYLHTNSAVTINPMNEKESDFVLLCHGDELPKI